MKRLTLTTAIFFSALAAFAQWNQSALTGASYHTGAVAIGFDPPSYPLHIMTGSNMDRSFGFTSADDFLSSRSALFYTAGGLGSGPFQYAGHLFIQPRTNAQRGIYFNTFDGTSTASRLAITWDGKVGIGTITPGFNLDVVNTAGSATLRVQGNSSSTSWRARLLLDRVDDFRAAGMWIESTGGTETKWYAGVPYTGNGFSIGNHGSQPEYKDNSKFFIKPNGQTGIGTTVPVGSFDVKSHQQAVPSSESVIMNIVGSPASPSMADNLFQLGEEVGPAGETNAIFRMGNRYTNAGIPDEVVLRADGASWLNGGNVGIGTTTPVGNLEIFANTTGGDQLHIGNANTAGRATVALKQGTTTKAFFQYRGTTNASFANTVRLMTQSGTNADIILGANGGHHIFIAGGQNGTAMGNVGIGTATPDSKLSVKGTIHAEEVRIDLSVPGPDYVFEKDYPLPSLEEVKNFIDEHKHLPEVPSAKEMEENGVKVGEMNMILLKKVEELTLYVIEQNKLIAQLQEERTASPDVSAKQVEELMLYVIELKKENTEFRKLNAELIKTLGEMDHRLSKMESERKQRRSE